MLGLLQLNAKVIWRDGHVEMYGGKVLMENSAPELIICWDMICKLFRSLLLPRVRRQLYLIDDSGAHACGARTPTISTEARLLRRLGVC